METIAALAPGRSFAASVVAESGLGEHDTLAGMAREFARQVRALEAGYGRDGAIIRLRALVDAQVACAGEACSAYQDAVDRVMRAEVRAARADRLTAADRQALLTARAGLRGRAVAARVAADAALGAASALASYIREGDADAVSSGPDPRQLALFAAVG